MDSGTIFLLAVVGVLGLAFLFLFATARRRDTERAISTLPEEAVPAETEDRKSTRLNSSHNR
jgi:hypothetical protein